MSGNTVRLVHDLKFGWMLLHGNETFFDENRNLRTWDYAYDAERWFKANCPDWMILVKDEPQKRMDIK